MTAATIRLPVLLVYFRASMPTPSPDIVTLTDNGGRLRPAPGGRGSPARLGRYEVVHEIGKGAMGVVYRARDPVINREVALKAIPLAVEFEGRELEEARAKFFREAETAGRLSHPNIVTIYDAGEHQGTAYIAMELLRGRHLVDFTGAARSWWTGLSDRKPPVFYLVIVGKAEKRFAIAVDSLRGQQDIVIKPLDDTLGRSYGVVGASILGDGRIILIVDIMSFYNKKEVAESV